MLGLVIWSARKTNSNTVELKAESPVDYTENAIIQEMIRIIEIAQQFKGVPYQDPVEKEIKSKLTVYCSILFPNEVACWAFIEEFPNRVGEE